MRHNSLNVISQLLLFILCFTTNCKNHYNETIDWSDNIKKGTNIQKVKEDQPDFVTIDWSNPDTLKNQIRFPITKIKGSNDVLGMSHYLVFIDNKYEGRESHK